MGFSRRTKKIVAKTVSCERWSMLSFVSGLLFFLFLLINTLVCFSIMVPAMCLKPLADRTSFSTPFSVFLIKIVTLWADGNTLILDLLKNHQWKIEIPQELKPDQWYLLICNHQSWADIFVIFKAFNHKIPFPKFFVKEELMLYPILGVVFWAMDFPIMKRYSKSYLEQHPQQKGRDLETTRQSCEKFKDLPTTVVNFLEGSRYKTKKAIAQDTPYRHLLLPKAGGTASVLYSMGDYLSAAIDVTIAYEKPRMTMWDIACGPSRQIMVHADLVPIPRDFMQRDYRQDAEFRQNIQQWINQKWTAKDTLIESFRENCQSSQTMASSARSDGNPRQIMEDPESRQGRR